MSKQPNNKLGERVWEIDFVRGVLIFLVLCNHLNITVEAFCINGYYNNDSYAWVNITDPLHIWFDWGSDGVIISSSVVMTARKLLTHPAVNLFFVVSGISCLFSRNNLRRSIIMLAAAYAISAFTKGIDLLYGTNDQFIRFGVMQCYGYCHLIYYFIFEKRSNKTLLISAAVILLIGYYLRYEPISIKSSLLLPFGIYEEGAIAVDYWPIFPMLGWMLLGVVLGRKFYPEKKSLLPDCPLAGWTKPLRFLGRHSGIIYVSHIVIYTVVFCGIGYIFNLY